MQSKLHGIISLFLIDIAIFIAACTTASLNLILIILISFLWCHQICLLCKNHYPHLLPGLFAKDIKRQPGPYTKLERYSLDRTLRTFTNAQYLVMA